MFKVAVNIIKLLDLRQKRNLILFFILFIALQLKESWEQFFLDNILSRKLDENHPVFTFFSWFIVFFSFILMFIIFS